MSKNTPETRQILLDAFKDGATHTKAAQIAGISRVALWNWRIKDPKFARQIDDAQRARVKMVEDALFVGAMKGNPTCQIFYLKNKAGYKDGPDIQINNLTRIDYGWDDTASKSKIPASDVPERST